LEEGGGGREEGGLEEVGWMRGREVGLESLKLVFIYSCMKMDFEAYLNNVIKKRVTKDMKL